MWHTYGWTKPPYFDLFGGIGGGGGAYSCVACLFRLTTDYASFSRWSVVFTPHGGTSNILALITFLPYITQKPSHILSPSDSPSVVIKFIV